STWESWGYHLDYRYQLVPVFPSSLNPSRTTLDEKAHVVAWDTCPRDIVELGLPFFSCDADIFFVTWGKKNLLAVADQLLAQSPPPPPDDQGIGSWLKGLLAGLSGGMAQSGLSKSGPVGGATPEQAYGF